VTGSDVDRLARAYLLWARTPGDPEVADLVAEHGPARTAELVSVSSGRRWKHYAKATVEQAHTRDLRLVVPGDEDWPPALSDAAPPVPVGLWVRGRGRLDQLAAHAVGIVGSRQSTPYGQRVAAELGRELSRAGWTVIALGRFGADSAALRGADQVHLPVVVLPLGRLVNPRPAGHRKLFDRLAYRGVLAGEHASKLPDRYVDARRQSELLAVLVTVVIMIEPDPLGVATGCLKAAHHAGRPVLAVPGPVDAGTSDYAHHLIRAGRARLVGGVEDVLAELE
jgi:DNA processing protein